MKRLLTISFLTLLFFSCTDKQDDGWNIDTNDNAPKATKRMELKLTGSSLTTLAAHNITELDLFVFLNDSLVYGKNLSLNDDNLQIEVPLGENLKTFAVANADKILDTDSLKKITIYQNANSQKEIFVSDILSFVSDKTVETVPLELKRMVGEVVFQPTESNTQLTAITKFDALQVKFNNVVTGFMPGINQYILSDIIIPTTLAQGYKASVYSFPTPGDDMGSIEVIYMKNNAEVNRTLRPLDVAIKFESSKRTVVNMPILNGNYLEKQLSAKKNATLLQSGPALIVNEFQF